MDARLVGLALGLLQMTKHVVVFLSLPADQRSASSRRFPPLPLLHLRQHQRQLQHPCSLWAIASLVTAQASKCLLTATRMVVAADHVATGSLAKNVKVSAEMAVRTTTIALRITTMTKRSFTGPMLSVNACGLSIPLRIARR